MRLEERLSQLIVQGRNIATRESLNVNAVTDGDHLANMIPRTAPNGQAERLGDYGTAPP